MKKFVQLLALMLIGILCNVVSMAQTGAPAGITFQGIATDASGNIAMNATVFVKDAIIKSSANGSKIYSESFSNLKTTEDGIFTIIIGQGSSQSGSFNDINWANGPYFLNLQVAIKPLTATSSWTPSTYYSMGTQQFWSVPYALNAGTVPGLSALIADTASLAARIAGHTTQINALITDSATLINRFSKNVKYTDTSNMLSPYQRSITAVKYSDTAFMLSKYPNKTYVDANLATKQNKFTLTTIGTSGAATLVGATLNIPQASVGATGQDGTNGTNGTNGNNGAAGAAGATGADGKTAYDVAITNGFVGTQSEFITSLKGASGNNGAAGADGSNGTNGVKGDTGATGSVADVGTISGSSTANGASISSGVLHLAPADGTNGGIVTNAEQTIAGIKTFSDSAVAKGFRATDSLITKGFRATGTAGADSISTRAFKASANILVSGITIGVGAQGNSGLGYTNVAVGYESLKSQTIGDFNVAVGYQTLSSNTIGEYNTAVGRGVLSSYTGVNGAYNAGFGSGALTATTRGLNNTAIGTNSLFVNTTGSQNTALGKSSLFTNTTGNNNTALGYNADVIRATLTNATAIGNGAIVTGNNHIQLGNGSIDTVFTNGKLKLGAITLPNTDGTANQVLSTNGSGVVAWATAAAAPIADASIELAKLSATGTKSPGYFLMGNNTWTQIQIDGSNFGGITPAPPANTGGYYLNMINGMLGWAIPALPATGIMTAITAKSYILTVPAAISSAATTTVDLSTGSIFKISLGASITTLTLNNPNAGTYILELIQNATGSFTVAFPSGWKWMGGSAPTITTTANKTDIITLVYDGTTYFASAVQNF